MKKIIKDERRFSIPAGTIIRIGELPFELAKRAIIYADYEPNIEDIYEMPIAKKEK